MSDFTLTAIARSTDQQGKGASRRLRRENLVPAIVYGGKEEPATICLKNNELVKALESEAFFSSIVNLTIDGKSEEVIIKALQRHPAKGHALHVDFQRVVRGQLMNFTVPIHFEGTAVGVEDGGILATNVTEVEVSCLPRQLPEYIRVDVSAMNIGDALHLSDIQLPEGLTILELANDGTDRTIATVQPPTIIAEPEAEAEDDILGTTVDVPEVEPDEVPSTEA